MSKKNSTTDHKHLLTEHIRILYKKTASLLLKKKRKRLKRM